MNIHVAFCHYILGFARFTRRSYSCDWYASLWKSLQKRMLRYNNNSLAPRKWNNLKMMCLPVLLSTQNLHFAAINNATTDKKHHAQKMAFLAPAGPTWHHGNLSLPAQQSSSSCTFEWFSAFLHWAVLEWHNSHTRWTVQVSCIVTAQGGELC